MPARTRIALGTLCVFNALTLTVLGLVGLFFVDGLAAPVAAAGLWLAAYGLLRLSRHLREGTDW
jgi:hypothetical protein